MVHSTLVVYKEAVSHFLPTPAKSHYVFNLRDFARVVKGILLVPSSNMKEGDKLMRLWVHEVYRVFYDRLIDDSDRDKFFQIVKETCGDNFKTNIDKVRSTRIILVRSLCALSLSLCLNASYRCSVI